MSPEPEAADQRRPLAAPDHATAVADMAVATIVIVRGVATELGEPLDVRIGIHSSPVVAGLIGKHTFIYDL